MSTPADSAREGARQRDGKFGTYSLGEDTDVDLAAEIEGAASAMHEDFSSPWPLAHGVDAETGRRMREDLRSKLRNDLRQAGRAAKGGPQSDDMEEQYSQGWAVANSQALAALDPDVEVADLESAGGRIRLAMLDADLSRSGTRDASEHPGISAERSDAVARRLFRQAAFCARNSETADHNSMSRFASMSNGQFNGHIYNATSFVEGTTETSFDGHSNAARVLREWARSEEGKREDPDDPETSTLR